MSRFDTYTDRLLAGSPVTWNHQLISSSGEILASNIRDEGEITWGARVRPLSHQAARVSNKTSTLTIPVNDSRLMPDKVGSLLHPDTGNRIRSWAGIYGADGEPVWSCQSTMLAGRVEATSRSQVGTLSIPLVDMLRPLRSQTLELFEWQDGESVETVIGRMLGQVFDDYSITSTGFRTPFGSIGIGSDRARFVIELLEGCGHEITTTPLGEVITRKILATTDDGGPRWKYGGDDGLPIDNVGRTWNPKTPQAFHVEGGSFQNLDDPIEITVFDTDPTSEGYYDGRSAAQVESRRYQWAKTRLQCAEAGYGQLRRHGVGPMVVRFQAGANPFLKENDLVDLTEEVLNVDGIFRVTGFELPQQNDGQMTVEARKIYDPQKNFRPPVDVEGCVPSFSDDFDRPDQNLENTRDGGSDNWIEHGYSYNLRNRECVQLNEAWCLGLWKNPICGADHYSEIVISRIPSGKYLGPACGSAGGFECYAAVVDHNGIMRLEKWINGRKAAQLGRARIGAPAGRTVGIQREGTTITAWSGSTTIVAEHSGLRGTWAGMLGTGGWGAAGSALSSINAGEL